MSNDAHVLRTPQNSPSLIPETGFGVFLSNSTAESQKFKYVGDAYLLLAYQLYTSSSDHWLSEPQRQEEKDVRILQLHDDDELEVLSEVPNELRNSCVIMSQNRLTIGP